MLTDAEWEAKIAKKEAKSYAKAEARRVAKATTAAAKPSTRTYFKCMHTCTKYRCQNCTTRCYHMKAKGGCKICPDWGSKFCEHGKFKFQCITCTPSRYCPHGKRKHRCRECPSFKEEHYEHICQICFAKTVCRKGAVCATCRKEAAKAGSGSKPLGAV